MRAAISLLMLLFCVCGAVPASTQPDVSRLSTELQELRDMVAELRGALKSEARQAVSEAKADSPKVAFFVGLPYGYTESPSRDFLNLVWTEVMVNVGNAYDSTTGYFTAPVRGVYVFRFEVMNELSGNMNVNIHAYKNDSRFMVRSDHDDDGRASYLSGGLTLLLEVGDTIRAKLEPASRLYNDPVQHSSTFSGFLLFAL